MPRGRGKAGKASDFGSVPFAFWERQLKIGMTETGVWNDKNLTGRYRRGDAVTPKVCTGLDRQRLPTREASTNSNFVVWRAKCDIA